MANCNQGTNLETYSAQMFSIFKMSQLSLVTLVLNYERMKAPQEAREGNRFMKVFEKKSMIF